MARPKNTYSRSDETYEVLRDHVRAIAKEYPCDDSHIYAIKDGRANDPYPPFRHLFKSALYAGAPVKRYLRDLSGLVENHECRGNRTKEIIAELSRKIEADAVSTSELLSGVQDNNLDRVECQRVLDALEISRAIEEGIKVLVERRLAELNDGRQAVSSFR